MCFGSHEAFQICENGMHPNVQSGEADDAYQNIKLPYSEDNV